ncbi:hypothetical protein A2U01_0071414, partial [Trifolium medium]|nr:hypothetical protein [Trifolium medium]
VRVSQVDPVTQCEVIAREREVRDMEQVEPPISPGDPLNLNLEKGRVIPVHTSYSGGGRVPRLICAPETVQCLVLQMLSAPLFPDLGV